MALVDSVIDTKKVIDTRNRKLWEEILSEYEVSVEASHNEEHHCYTESKKAIIYIPLKDICPDSFTHELLHIYIRQKGVFIGTNLKLKLLQSNILAKIFVPGLVEHVGNCLDHIKMFPVYVSLGFQNEKFLFDYHTPKCTDQEISDIKSQYKFGSKFYSKAVEVYIGKYIGIKGEVNEEFDYKKHLTALKKIDEELFYSLENLTTSWMDLNIESDNPAYDYKSIVSTFYQDLKEWMTGKQFL
jgi:hypothetical protein